MATKQELLLFRQQMGLAKRMFIAGILILIGASFLWFSRVHGNPNSVFWGMVDANLKSYGRSTTIIQNDATAGLDQQQRNRVQLGQQNLVAGETKLIQNEGRDNQIAITTQTISTRDANYVRYSHVAVANNSAAANKDFSSLTSAWAKDDSPLSGSSAYIQALFGSLGQIPVGNLSKDQRKELIQYMKDQKVYTLQRVHKDSRNHRPVVIYDATIAMDRYVGMLKKFDAMMGLKQLENVEPSQFRGQQPVNINFIVDVASRNLLEFGYTSNQQKEHHEGYGAYRKVELPAQTITLPELEQRLQTTLFGQ